MSMTNQNPSTTKKGPLKNTKNNKHKWTREERIGLIKCFYLAEIKGLPIVKGTFDIWRESYPNLCPKMTSLTLSSQRRYIINNCFTEIELKKIRTEVSNEQNQNCKDTNEGGTNPSKFNPSIDGSNFQGLDTHSQNINTTNDLPELSDNQKNLLDTITVLYSNLNQEDIEVRKRPKKFKLNKENKKRLEEMNEILTVFISLNEIKNISDLDSLMYAAAITLSGETQQHKFLTKPSPNLHINLKIKNIRRKIGRLHMAKIKNKLNE